MRKGMGVGLMILSSVAIGMSLVTSILKLVVLLT